MQSKKETNTKSDPKAIDFITRLLSPLNQEDWGDDLAEAALWGYQHIKEKGPRSFSLTLTTGPAHTYVHVIYKAVPFLQDSLVMHLREKGYHGLLSLSASPSKHQNTETMYVLIRLNQVLDTRKAEEITEALKSVGADVLSAVDDWQAMREKLKSAADGLKSKNDQPFLNWMHEGFFTFLGYRFFDGKGVHVLEKDLGMTKQYQDQSFFGMDRETEKKILVDSHSERPLQVTKTMVQATVHRPVPMDVVRIHAYDGDHLIGEHQFFGLFTAHAYSMPISETPSIGEKLDALLHAEHVSPESHEGRHLAYALSTVPKDILFQTETDALKELVHGIVGLRHRHRLSLFVLPDALGHFVSCLVYAPRDRYTPPLAMKMGEMLAACYKGALMSHEVHMGGDLTFARVHYIISTDAHPQHRIVCDVNSTEALLEELSLPWTVKLKSITEGAQIDLEEDLPFFPELYQKRYTPSEGVRDYAFIKQALHTGKKAIQIYIAENQDQEEIHIKIFSPQYFLSLADTFPVLENMGLSIQSEHSIQLGEASTCVWLHHFIAVRHYQSGTTFARVEENFKKVLTDVFDDTLENDRFNCLALSGNASERHILLMRAYYAYMRQVGWPHTRASVVPVLEKYPFVLKNLKDLFYARFDPQSTGDEAHLIRETESLLAAIESAEEEMVFARMVSLILATERTNYFQKTNNGKHKPYVSLKIKAGDLKLIEGHKGFYEIFVYAPDVEGIHLRSGAVARGGIRWSDRRSDYRREVMDLMRAQFVKNAVIVPMGAKGGFYVKKNLSGLSFDARSEIGVAAYKTFVSGLLDVVDNRTDKGAIAPDDTVVHGAEDAYLVVAADKGTATFSDTANALSIDHNFWLGDAFASGGSSGYDHKKMGITSRGAWESVKRHFRELSISMETPFTVAGVGDMSGDVFGNGMLLSKNIQLVAAFNHAHIFIDPTPDVEKSYQERQRLFNMPRTGWNDYNEDCISEGGGVYSRKEKLITLSEKAVTHLGLEKTDWAPQDLIKEILKLPVDLLWFGGIGTYIKDASERHGEVADHANDLLRIDGDQVKARVIGEGANLGLTQKGRVACALLGTRLNRDSVDNAGGVHCSDYEVNIKILFQDVMKKKGVSLEERNTILKEMTEDVARLVLRSNADQTLAISLEMVNGKEDLSSYVKVIRFLEKKHFMKRADEFLPTDDQFEQMMEKEQLLTRPEIAVLMSYIKLYLKEKLLQFPLESLEGWQDILLSYFPEKLQTLYADMILCHPLRHEIVVTELVNRAVNQIGIGAAYDVFLNTKENMAAVFSLYVSLSKCFSTATFVRHIGAAENDSQKCLTMFLRSFVKKCVKEKINLASEHQPNSCRLEKSYLHGFYEEYKKKEVSGWQIVEPFLKHF